MLLVCYTMPSSIATIARLAAVLAVWIASEPLLYRSAVIDGEKRSLATAARTHSYLGASPKAHDERHGHEPVDEPVADAAA